MFWDHIYIHIYIFLSPHHHQYQSKISFMPNAFKTTFIMDQIMLQMNLLVPFTQWSLLTQMPHPLIGQDQKWTSHQSTATVSGHHDKMRLPTWVLAGLCCNGYNRLLDQKKYQEGCAKEKRNTNKVLMGEPKRTRQLWRSRCRWYNNNEMDLKEVGWVDVESIKWLKIGTSEYLLRTH